MVVVDASVAGKGFVEEPGREQALSVLEVAERHAPDLIVAEVANVAWKKAIRGELTGDHARFICASLRRYFVVLHRSETLVNRAIDIALRLRHPIYECLYLGRRPPRYAGPETARSHRGHGDALLAVHVDSRMAWMMHERDSLFSGLVIQ